MICDACAWPEHGRAHHGNRCERETSRGEKTSGAASRAGECEEGRTRKWRRDGREECRARKDLGACLIGGQRGRSSASSGWKATGYGQVSAASGAACLAARVTSGWRGPCVGQRWKEEVTAKRASRTSTGPVALGRRDKIGRVAWEGRAMPGGGWCCLFDEYIWAERKWESYFPLRAPLLFRYASELGVLVLQLVPLLPSS